ncbi:MAG: DNA-3-methyladenine glycosylase 2 family protein [Candidatus Limnocylindrales bacterium]
MTGSGRPAAWSGRPAADSGDPLLARFALSSPIDLTLTLAPLSHGRDDPTIRFAGKAVWLARATAAGPATLRLAAEPAAIVAQAWGPGAELALEAAPGLAGLLDDPSLLVPRDPLVHELARRFAGLRLPRTGQLVPALIPAVTEQKVTASEAHGAYVAIARRLGEPAPGPMSLLLPVAAARLATLPYFELHPLGLERRRAELLRRIGRQGEQIESWTALLPEEARARLRTIPGIGPWTAAEATRAAFGDPDAVSVGDAHLPDLVSWALAGEPRADDARMLEILASYAGQRARVVRLLEASGLRVPRFGPRFAPRGIAGI